jgi:hypothetical protein
LGNIVHPSPLEAVSILFHMAFVYPRTHPPPIWLINPVDIYEVVSKSLRFRAVLFFFSRCAFSRAVLSQMCLHFPKVFFQIVQKKLF